MRDEVSIAMEKIAGDAFDGSGTLALGALGAGGLGYAAHKKGWINKGVRHIGSQFTEGVKSNVTSSFAKAGGAIGKIGAIGGLAAGAIAGTKYLLKKNPGFVTNLKNAFKPGLNK